MGHSNGKDATPAQYLEHLRRNKGLVYAKQKRDELGWQWRPSALWWTIKHSWVTWTLAVGSLAVALVGMLVDLQSLFG